MYGDKKIKEAAAEHEGVGTTHNLPFLGIDKKWCGSGNNERNGVQSRYNIIILRE